MDGAADTITPQRRILGKGALQETNTEDQKETGLWDILSTYSCFL